jgi:DHA3 family macrolide efflux protein-like MFS transporter
MVPERHLTRVGGMNQTLDGLLRIAAPPLGALLLDLLPLYSVLAIDIGTALIAIAPLLLVRIPNPRPESPAESPLSVLEETRAGFDYVWHWRALFWIVLTCGMADFFTAPAISFLPLMVTQELGGDAMQLAMVNAASGIGLVAGGFLMSLWGGFRRRIVSCLVGWATAGAACIAWGLSPDYGWALSSSLTLGLTSAVGIAALTAFYQSCVAPEQQGRFFGVLGAINSATMPLGLIVAGAAGARVGPREWLVLMGVAHIALGIGWALVPSILHAEDHLPGRESDKEPDAQPALEVGTS